jgi:anthranilate phosphoribosyltransferase
VSGVADNFRDAADQAAAAISSSAAKEKLTALATFTNEGEFLALS